MTVKKGKDLGIAWECECGKWNFAEAEACWKCHSPKLPIPSKKRGRPKKEVANAY